MKLKDYAIPQYGLPEGQAQEDLEQYSLKNFDLNLLKHETDSPSPLNEQSFSHAPDPVQPELNRRALDPYDVQFGAHFNLQTVSYNPLTPAQQWKIPRWVVTMVGLFFGSAAVLALAFCVVLLRDPKAAPTAPLAVPTAPVAATSVAPGDVARAPSAPEQETTTSALGHRMVVSRHPSVVRRQIYSPRRVASKSTSSSVAPQETETAISRPPKDALDQLLGESSL